MPTPFLWLALLGPAAIAGAVATPGYRPRSQLVPLACAANLAVALAVAAAVVVRGPLRTATLGWAGVGFGLYVDSLSAAVFGLVSFIGLVVVTYCRNYMAGDLRHGRFTRVLALTLASVLVVTVSGNLLQFDLAWLGMSVGLQALLRFYPERRAAILGARKHLIASAGSYACILVATALVHRLFGTLDLAAVLAGASVLRASAVVPPLVHVVSILLAVAGLLKSAQFPMHGWLMEVMETPTPVSALLHAGIINAGGFLLLRCSGLVSLSLPALELLVVIGGFTALFGSVVMLTQTSIKVTLATSTVAQMGFMMLECGLGAFPAALLHLLAHSLYKAHAFLSSGSVLDIARSSWAPSPGGRPHPARTVVAVVAVLAVGFELGRTFGFAPTEQPGVFALGAVLLLGLIHLVSAGIDERPSAYVVGRIALLAAAVGATYFALQLAMQGLFGGSVPATVPLRGPFALTVETLVVVAFALVTLLQGGVPGDREVPRWQGLHALVWNGFYVNTFLNRWLLQAWPIRREDRR